MTEMATLKALPRQETGKGPARRMRREGRIPAVIYGREEETRSLSIDALEFENLMRHVSLDNTLIELSIKGKRGKIRALVGEIQVNPVKAEVLHVDFHQIQAGEKVHVDVPIRLEGAAAGVKEGGVLQHVLHEVEVRCASDAIPEAFTVDVSALLIGDSIHIADMEFPEGVEVQVDEDRTVCLVAAPRVLVTEEEEAAAALEEGAEPELVGREGEEEDEAEGEESEAES
ncbi:MAG TPA: 50S ribosomal protein L25/general stress protein Ctc [Longimicrobiales bacterium]|nr:50S ribosomal protein L25/general stress protein Ctc [Longimicrobiales bacterium]